jgi:hypothetical protein
MQGIESLNNFKKFVSSIGGLGRYEDTYIVHAAEGETVVPMEVLDRNPALKKRLFKTMMEMGIEPGRYIVGNELNSKNPVTGQPEFFLKRIKKALADISGYAAPVIGAMYGAPAGALAGGILGSFKRENPGDPTQGMQMALRGGLAGLGSNIASGQSPFLGRGARGIFTDAQGNMTFNPFKLGSRIIEDPMKFLKDDAGDFRFMNKFFPSADITSVDQLEAFNAEYDSILNSDAGRKVIEQLGEEKGKAQIAKLAETATKTKGQSLIGGMNFKDLLGLYAAGTIGLGAIIDSTTDNQDVGLEKDMTQGNVIESILDPKPVFAEAGGVMDLRQGGESEGPGTGTSDDIPAMLSDGEFVMTAKAVRGAGGGDRREGAKKMYEAMNNLEARA